MALSSHYMTTGGNGRPDDLPPGPGSVCPHIRGSRWTLSDYFLCAGRKNAIPTILPDQAGALTPPASPAHGETTDGPGTPYFVGAIFMHSGRRWSAFGSWSRSLLASNSTMELQTNTVGIQASGASRDRARQQATADLIADARTRADALAKAAGVTLGAIVGIGEPGLAVTGPNTVPIYGPYGPVGQSGVKTTFSIPVRFAIK